jgi:hypothetical protein
MTECLSQSAIQQNSGRGRRKNQRYQVKPSLPKPHPCQHLEEKTPVERIKSFFSVSGYTGFPQSYGSEQKYRKISNGQGDDMPSLITSSVHGSVTFYIIIT